MPSSSGIERPLGVLRRQHAFQEPGQRAGPRHVFQAAPVPSRLGERDELAEHGNVGLAGPVVRHSVLFQQVKPRLSQPLTPGPHGSIGEADRAVASRSCSLGQSEDVTVRSDESHLHHALLAAAALSDVFQRVGGAFGDNIGYSSRRHRFRHGQVAVGMNETVIAEWRDEDGHRQRYAEQARR